MFNNIYFALQLTILYAHSNKKFSLEKHNKAKV